MVAIIEVGCCVGGRFGPLLPEASNPGGTTSEGRARRKRAWAEGTVVASVAEKQWRVSYEHHGVVREEICNSNRLVFISNPKHPSIRPNAAARRRIDEGRASFGALVTEATAGVVSLPPSTVVEQRTQEVVEEMAAAPEVGGEVPDVEPTAEVPDVEPTAEVQDIDVEPTAETAEVPDVGVVVDADDVDPDEGELVDTNWENEITEMEQEAMSDDQDKYERCRIEAKAHRDRLISERFTVEKKSGNKVVKWMIVEDSEPDRVFAEYSKVGVRDINWEDFTTKYAEGKPAGGNGKKRKLSKKRFPYSSLFRALWPGDWKKQLEEINMRVESENKKVKSGGAKVRLVSEREFWRFIGIMVAAGPLRKGGKHLFGEAADKHKRRGQFESLTPQIDLAKYMTLRRFEQIKHVFPFGFQDKSKSDPKSPEYDPWFPILGMVDGFNANRKKTIAASAMKVLDESMSALRPRNTKTGGYPHISFIKRKPEPLGTEFKAVCCGETGVLLFLEIQRGKEGMNRVYGDEQRAMGATSACTVRAVKNTVGCGQRETGKSELACGDSWFASVNTVEQIKKAHPEVEFVGPVKTAHRFFPKEEIEREMEKWPGGTSLVLEAKGLTGTPLVAIGYKYNSRKVLCFVASKNAGSTKMTGTPYKARWRDSHGNQHSRAIKRPDLLARYFEGSNLIDSHNHARQYELRLEKHWVTTNCWFRLVTTLIGMTVVDCWKSLRHAMRNQVIVKLGFPEMSVTEFADSLAFELLHQKFDESIPVPTALSPLESGVAGDEDNSSDASTETEESRQGTRRSPRLLKKSRRALEFHSRDAIIRTGEAIVSDISGSERGHSSISIDPFHTKLRSGVDSGKGRAERRRCSYKGCGKLTGLKCIQCDRFFCEDFQGGSARECWTNHKQRISLNKTNN